MATIKDLANRYGLEDYEQLLGGYPNAEKFITGLKDAAVRAVPTTEQMRDPNFIIDTAGLGGAIKAYHGTPHLFDRFDMSKIGTGEGAQAYGHGLYLAQEPLTAKTYMTAGVPVDEYQNKIFLKKYHADTAKLRGDVERENALLQEIKDMEAQKGGNIYETSIQWPSAEREVMDPLGEHHLLDWNKSLSEQSDYVKNKLKKSDFYKNAKKAYKDQKQWYLDPSEKTGESFLKYMRSGYGDETGSGIQDAEQYLNNLGIPGLKYLDATSRGTEKGTRNYVMFGDEYPQIVKRAGSLDELANKYNEMHPDKNHVSWDLTSDSHFDEEGYEMPGDPYVLIEKVYTHPDDRNKGVATRLMSDAMKEIESKHPNMPIKLSPIPLDKDTDIERLADFYKKFGFDEMPEGHMQKYAEGGAVDSAISDYKQLLSGYPNTTKFVNALQSGIESHIPTTEDLQSPERMGEWSLAAALNQPTGLATKPIKNLNQALLDKYIERGYLPEDELAKYEKNAAKMRNAGRQDINVQNAQANPEYEAYKAEYDVPFMHGTERLDRVLSKEGLDPKRATSGPMLYGTDSPEIASSYAKNKQDTSMMDDDDWNYSKAFTVAPQQLGHRGTIPYTVEQSWNYLDPEVRRDILTKAPRVGHSDLDQWQGDFVLHPEGEGNAINQSHYDYLLKQSRGNPIKAMRDYWLDSGNLFNEEEKMSQLYRLAGYPHEISQEMAPWTKREGVLTGVSRIRNPLDTSNVDELREKVIPALKDAFKNDRSRKKDYGADSWDKNTRYTPKEWVNELENDLNKGENSYVWTSIPDKITSELKRLGYNGIYDTGGKSAGADSHQVTIPFNPSQIRSKFAAFDPILKHSPNLLAGTALGSVLLHDEDQGYAEGGSVKDLHDKYEESDYGYGNRQDKTKKGLGYFGELERPDGTGVMTEYSIGVPINGKEMDIPTLVPTLTPEEVQHILNIKEGERIPRSIVNKAIDHAHKRIKEDKPVFATEKDLYADGGSVVEDLPFNDPDQLRLYHQAMQHFDDLMENTGGSKKMGKTEARINYNTTTKGDRDRDKDLHTLIADYGIDVGKDAKINATMIKPMEAEGVYLGNLTGSVPVGEGRASLGLQGLHTKYSDGLSGYTAGYNGKVGGGDLSASYFEPADHNSAGRQVQLEYSMPFADGGSVSEFEDPAHERLYRRAMAHFDNLVNA